MADLERVDKFLWAIRAFKTRTEAADACKGNKVKMGGEPAKPSKMIKAGDKIEVRKGAAIFTYKVIQPLGNRVGAKEVPKYAENLTPQSEIDKLKSPNETFFLKRDSGSGRPTKKDRRVMEDMWAGIGKDYDDDPSDEVMRHFGLDEDDLK
jgi:ribosome-associated heat shock protein Hsp15